MKIFGIYKIDKSRDLHGEYWRVWKGDYNFQGNLFMALFRALTNKK